MFRNNYWQISLQYEKGKKPLNNLDSDLTNITLQLPGLLDHEQFSETNFSIGQKIKLRQYTFTICKFPMKQISQVKIATISTKY